MTDPLIAHVRFSDHVARCEWCRQTTALRELCDTGRELLNTWQRAEQLATRQAEEADAAFALDDEYTAHPEDRLEAEA